MKTKYELREQTNTTSTRLITDAIATDFMLGLLHGFLMPLLIMLLMQSRFGALYILIPLAAYETIAKDRESKDFFTVFAIVLVIGTIASWADAMPQ